MLGRNALPDSATGERREVLELTHPLDRDPAPASQPFGMLGIEEIKMLAQGRLKVFIIGHGSARNALFAQHHPGRLASRGTVIQSGLGDQPSRHSGQFLSE